MGLMGKLIVMGAVVGAGSYFYDLNYAERKLFNAKVKSVDTDHRCRNNHESMCKYYATVEIKKIKSEYTFRIPFQYYHAADVQLKPGQKLVVQVKMKKIYGQRILGLKPKSQARIDKMLSDNNNG